MKAALNPSADISIERIFQALPESYLVVLPDAPKFTIILASDRYLADTYHQRRDVVGKGVFEILTDDPNNLEATGVANLTASLQIVMQNKTEHRMNDQQYDIQHPQTHTWEHRIWRPLNKAVLDEEGHVQYIIHWVQDVTKQVELELQAATARQIVTESEARFRNMIEQAPIAITLTRGQNVVIESINAPMMRLMNQHQDKEVIGKKMIEVLPELRDQPAYRRVQHVQSSGISFQGDELPVDLMIDGAMQRRYFNFSYTPVVQPDMETGVLHVAVDVTELVTSKRRVEESEQRSRLMAEMSPNLVWTLNPDGSYQYVNQTTLDYIGVTQEQIATSGWGPFVHPDDLERVSHALSKAVQSGKPYNAEHRLRAKSGKYRWFFSQALPAFLNDGTISAYIGASVDIHDTRKAREKLKASEAELQTRVIERTKELSEANVSLRQSNKELLRSNQQLDEFAHAASHDLKEPIRKIQVFASQLKMKLLEKMNEQELQILERVENASLRMSHLVDDLLMYSYVSTTPMERKMVDLNELITSVCADLELSIQEKGALIRVTNTLPVIQGYRRQLHQLFQNLLSNALKYSKADLPPQIEITAELTEEAGTSYHLLKVKDNGIGFPQQQAEKIFQIFTRLHGKGAYSGTGVGLSIVKKVVENHNGFIRAESQLGEGAEFIIYFPTGDIQP